MDLKDQWDFETAMKIVLNQTVDSKLWADAIEWLLRYGPPEIVELLLQASNQATGSCFPELQPIDYTPEGQPCYDVAKIAESLGISEEEARDIIAKKEEAHRASYLFTDGSSKTIH